MYDLLILGGGPSGLTAGIYATRGGLRVAIIEKMACGGQLALTHEIDNYPSFESINGFELATKMVQHAEASGVEIIYDNILSVDLVAKSVICDTKTYQAKSIIIALGATPRLLGLENEKRLRGQGVSYCATCDGAFFRGKDVAVVGGGNTAVKDAIYLSAICNKVYLIHRRDSFRASKTEVDKIISNPKIECVMSSVVEDILGKNRVDSIVVKDLTNDTTRHIEVSGVFVAVGNIPNTEMFRGIALDDNGYIVTDSNMRTNISHVYAVGDITQKPLRQVITACSDGAIAGETAVMELN